jgi:hypothetical protein
VRKTITLAGKMLIAQMPIPTAAEVRKADDEARLVARATRRQLRVDASVQAVMPQIQAMRDAGAGFVTIQRVFARERIDISVSELRSTFEKLQAQAATAAVATSANTGERP